MENERKRFWKEFENINLGCLEPYREYIALHALDNAEGDTDKALACVSNYIANEEESKEIFSVYDV